MCAYNAIDTYAACANKNLLQDHLRNAWGFKGFVVSDCAAIMDVFNGHKNAPDITHAAAISVEAGTDLSCSIWAPGFNTLADAVRQKLVSEDLITRAAERLYTARFRLGLFDTSPYDSIPFSSNASAANRAQALKAAEEAIVLLKNDGTLPLKKAPASIAVVGPTADLIQSLEGNYNGVPVHPVEPVDGIAAQFAGSQIHYAQGSTLAEGAKVPVPRTAFNEGRGLTTEYFATPNWTGRPVAVSTDHNIQAEWGDSMPVPEIRTHVYSVRWSGKIAVAAAGHYTFSVEPADAFPYSPKDSYRLTLDGKVLGEGELRRAVDISAMGGNFKSAPGASPSAPPVFNGGTPAVVSVDFTDTNPHDFKLEYSHSGDQAGGGLYFKWAAPAQAQLDEAVAAAKQSDVVVAFVGLSPQLEGEEMPIKIDGFAGGDRTKIGLPAAQLNLLDAVAATGKPVVVVLMSGSAVAVPQDHAAAILEAWYPGVEGGTAIARTIAGLNNPAGRLPVTFYQSVDDLPAFDQYSMKNRTYRYYTGKPEWGFGFGLSYSTFNYGPVSLSSTKLQAGEPLTATVSVTNSSALAGDEVVEAYLKTPQSGGPIHSLAAFQRLHLQAGETRDVTLHFEPRQLSSVDEKGERSILPGKYELTLSAAQPEETKAKSETTFTVTGAQPLPR
jgi:beta-glucosidase